MKIRNSSDIYEDSGIGTLMHELNIGRYFVNKDYGNNEVALFFVINCVPHDFKLRKRYDSKGKTLYWDIILDYEKVKKSSLNEKKVILANAIVESFDILDSYKKLNIDKAKIKEDAKLFFESIGWLGSTN
jgi:hypothetical protein